MVQAPDVYVGQADLPHALLLVNEMTSRAELVANSVDNMIDRVRSGEMSSSQGLSYLEMKYQMLLSYLIDLAFVVLKKCSAEPIEHEPCIDRLIEIRTVLEKIRPLDNKLKYQIDKLVKSVVIGPSANDPISFKANPLNFCETNENADDDDEDEEDFESDGNTVKKEQRGSNARNRRVYVPPKVAPVHYYEKETVAERDRRLLERTKKHKLSAAIIQDLREEYLDIPIEVAESNCAQQKVNKVQQEKEAYEEEFFTRLPMSKKEKHMSRRLNLTTIGGLGEELVNLDDSLPSTSDGGGGRKKRKSNSFKGKGKKSAFKRKRF